MNKKKLIIISSVIVILCVIIGVFQHFLNTSKNKDKTSSISNIVTEEQANENSENNNKLLEENEKNETDVSNEEKQNNENNNGNTNNSNNKSNKENTPNKKTETPNGNANDFPHQNNNSAENKPHHSGSNNNSNNNKHPQKEVISVSLTISCKNALKYDVNVPASGYFLNTTTFEVKNGQSVFDVLSKACKENGISLYYEEKSYIKGIGGLNEKECTDGSGWMYRVNGTLPLKAATKYILKDGDKVEFYYVTTPQDMP